MDAAAEAGTHRQTGAEIDVHEVVARPPGAQCSPVTAAITSLSSSTGRPNAA